MRNLLLGEHNSLQKRTLHIHKAFKKPDINGMFTPKTTNQILALRKKFTSQSVFGRSDIMYALDIKVFRASELLKEMREKYH
ncbi:MAG: hypothetical protein SOS22_06350 [Absicoccus sp.]|uniref:hypothetical protein n=1 Tax=Absicoccus sp. TaxID=2718527 RepID=UPI002A762295|nr:hypothetical protein [Absicoccus sp.]MDY3035824.1 hypothetical protein [Absicoccus sp.]